MRSANTEPHAQTNSDFETHSGSALKTVGLMS